MKEVAVIFDMDGTLLDTIDDLSESANLVLKEEGLPVHDRDAYYLFVGNGARTLMERALPGELKGDNRLIERLLGKFRDTYRERQYDKTVPYDGITDILLKLRELRIPLGILSNKPHELVKEIAAHYFAPGLFSAIAGQKEGIPHKPDPRGAYDLAAELCIAPENCLFVGDSSVDMDTAVNAGMKAVGVSWGFRSIDELKAHRADYIIHSPEELLTLVR